MTYLVFTIMLNSAAQILMKLSTLSKASFIVNPYFMASGLVFTASLFVWQRALTSIPLSKAMPGLLISYALVVLFSNLFLGESVSVAQYLLLLAAIGALALFWLIS